MCRASCTPGGLFAGLTTYIVGETSRIEVGSWPWKDVWPFWGSLSLWMAEGAEAEIMLGLGEQSRSYPQLRSNHSR